MERHEATQIDRAKREAARGRIAGRAHARALLLAALLLVAAAGVVLFLFGWIGPGDAEKSVRPTDAPEATLVGPAAREPRPRGIESSDGSSSREEAEGAAGPLEGSGAEGDRVALRGRVLDERGRPVPHAAVGLHALVPAELLAQCDARWLPGTPFGRISRMTETDEEGRFAYAEVPSLPAESPYRGFRIVASTLEPPGFGAIGPIEVPAAGRREPVEIQLRPAFVLHGKVETPEGSPVAGARVFSGDVYSPFEARTDATGRFRIVPAPASRFWVWFHHPDFVYYEVATVDAITGPPPREVRLEAHAAGEIVVRVRDARGRPVAGALVVARSIRPPSSDFWTSGPEAVFVPERTVALTDEGGAALLRPAGLHWVTLRASAPGLGAVEHSKRPDDPPHWEAILEEGAVLEGVVTRPDGTPAGGAEIRLLQLVRSAGSLPAKDVLRSTRRLATFRAREDGTFRYAIASADVAWEGPLYLRAVGAGGAVGWAGPLGPAYFDDPRPLVVKLGEGRRVEVLVRNAEGGPVGGAEVTAELAIVEDEFEADEDEEGERIFLPFERRTTGTEGRALFESLPRGPVRFAVRADGFAPTRSAVLDPKAEDADAPVVLDLVREARLVVRVHDEQGEPTPGLVVLVFPRNLERLVGATGDDGTVTFAGLPGGEAQVWFVPPWKRADLDSYSFLHPDRDLEEGPSRALVQLEPGRETLVERTIALPSMGRLRGRVTFLHAVRSATITTHWKDERHDLDFWRRTELDGEGRFDFGLVPAGKHRIMVGPLTFDVEVPAGGERDALLSVALGSVRGRVLVEGEGGHGALQVTFDRYDEKSGEWRRFTQVSVGEDGEFEVAALPTGRWRALPWGRGICDGGGREPVEFEVEPDGREQIEVRAQTGGWLRVEVVGWARRDQPYVALVSGENEWSASLRPEGAIHAGWVPLRSVPAGPAEVRIAFYAPEVEEMVVAASTSVEVPAEDSRCGRNLKAEFDLSGR